MICSLQSRQWKNKTVCFGGSNYHEHKRKNSTGGNQAVENYLKAQKGSTQIREELGIRLSSFQAWLQKYQAERAAGLHPKKCIARCPSPLKPEAVENYL